MFKPYDAEIIAYARREALLREAAAERMARQVARGQGSTVGCLAQALRTIAACLEQDEAAGSEVQALSLVDAARD